ncbi:MAG: GtrA family protein [Lachnospiraceae bacterium]|nr:GtrA family protein [Lachnospiraceae bacterium]
MVEKLLNLYKKYEEIVNYLVVGVAVTVFTWIVKFIVVSFIFDVEIVWQNTMATLLSDACGIIFAYFTNRKFVFKSKRTDRWNEFVAFASGRVGTTIFDVVAMDLFVWAFGKKIYLLAMIIVSVVVVVANYVLSKFFVFKDDAEHGKNESNSSEAE